MKTTRERILQNLLTYQNTTINDLAKAVGINAISVRHHLTSLQAEGLVSSEEERHGVGRPRLIYKLTEKGMEQFPTRYYQLTNRLLDQAKKNLSEKDFLNIINQISDSIIGDFSDKVKALPFEAKLPALKEHLAKEGFNITWETVGSEYHIHEISCPYFQIVQSHPEICVIGQRIISGILATPLKKTRCMLNGDNHCTYIIQESIPSEGLNI